MSPGLNHLPDFSKGEGASRDRHHDFQPLFATEGADRDWSSDTLEPADNTCDDLELLVSELGQAPVDPVEEPEIDEPTGVSQEEHGNALKELRDQHAVELENLRATHNEQVMQHLQSLQNGLVDDVADKLEMSVAQALLGLFKDKISQSTTDQLVAEIKQTIKKHAVERIQLAGPEPLTSAVTSALSDASVDIDVETTEAVDLIVHLNEQILSTRIEDWVGKLEKALA